MVGQDHVARALGNALRSGRPSQGYLFSGPRGTGKTTTARILARCLNCQSSPGPTPEPCGHCDSCRRTGQPGLARRRRGRRRLERPPHRRDARVARDGALRAGGLPLPGHDHGRGPPDPGPGRQRAAEDPGGAAAPPGGDPLHDPPLGHPGHDPLAPAALRAAQAGHPRPGQGARPGGALRGHRDLGARPSTSSPARPTARTATPWGCSTRSRRYAGGRVEVGRRAGAARRGRRARRSSSWST